MEKCFLVLNSLVSLFIQKKNVMCIFVFICAKLLQLNISLAKPSWSENVHVPTFFTGYKRWRAYSFHFPCKPPHR